MTVVVTRNVESRFRGFLLSCMPEVAPGLYVNAKLNAGIRDRVWEVLEDWHGTLSTGSILMIVEDKQSPSGFRCKSLGETIKEIVEIDGFYLTLKRVT
jgi:CRISPR-associated protein Cas2